MKLRDLRRLGRRGGLTMLLGFATGTLLATGVLALANATPTKADAAGGNPIGIERAEVEIGAPAIYLADAPLDPAIAQYCRDVIADAGGQDDADTGQGLFCAGLIATSKDEIDAGGYTEAELRNELETTEGRR
jgi:hypothetical protein